MASSQVPSVASPPGQREEGAGEPPPAAAPAPADAPPSGGPAPRVLVAVPAYNEERFIGSVVALVRLAGFEPLVVDDGSSDQTAAIASVAEAVVERHGRNLGKSAALNTAFDTARSLRVDALVVLDGDGQHDVREIQRVVAPVIRGDADVVIGSRFLPASSGRIPVVRRLGQIAVTKLVNAASGTRVSDSQSGFRAFSRRAVDLLRFGSDGFGAEVEMQFRARQLGLRVMDVPIVARYADPPKRSLAHHGALVLAQVLRLIGRHRPLLWFGTTGLVALGVAGGLALHVAFIYQRVQQLAIGHALLMLLCSLLGMGMIGMGILLHTLRGYFLELAHQIRRIGGEPGAREPRS